MGSIIPTDTLSATDFMAGLLPDCGLVSVNGLNIPLDQTNEM